MGIMSNTLLISREPLDINSIITLVTHEKCAGVSLFVETTREPFEGRTVRSLIYEAYESMAKKELQNICKELRSRFKDVFNIAICHRFGAVEHKEACMVMAIASPHQQTAIDALSYAIKQLKTKMTIWGRLVCEETTKKVSWMNYYAYRFMIRQNEDNYLLQFRRLLQQFCVDMYVKIETERLNYIRFNQAKLRSEEYIHLRDAIRTEGDARNLGRLTILPATYVGSPRHMHEYAQDAMAFVRQYGRPDLFVTFTCNSRWIDIQRNLIPGQTSSDRHDITACVFRQKLKVLMDFIIKQRVFGDVRCWMYSVEWQKRGLPHAHILLWFVEKIRLDEVDAAI